MAVSAPQALKEFRPFATLKDGASLSVPSKFSSKYASDMKMLPTPSRDIAEDIAHHVMEGSKLLCSYTLLPHGAKFDTPVTLVLPHYSKAPKERLGIFYVNRDIDGKPIGKWSYIPNAKFEAGRAIVSVTHFTDFAAFEFADVNFQKRAGIAYTVNKSEAVCNGLTYRGNCLICNRLVNCQMGIGDFVPPEDEGLENIRCPTCNSTFKAEKFILYNTQATIKWVKVDNTRGIQQHTALDSEVIAFGHNDLDATGVALYKSLRITTRLRLGSTLDVEVCFAMDCTGSMSPYINAGREQIRAMAAGLERELRRMNLTSRLRLGFVAYRDFEPNGRRPANLIQQVNLTYNLDTLVNTVSAQRAADGHDEPEHVVGALRAAADMDWQGTIRAFVLIADAPCHGSQYHNLRDTFPNGDPSGMEPPTYLNVMVEKNIHFIFLRICNRTDQMIERFRASYDNSPANRNGLVIETLELGTNTDVMGELILRGLMVKINDIAI